MESNDINCYICTKSLLVETHPVKFSCNHVFHRKCISTWLRVTSTTHLYCSKCYKRITNYFRLPQRIIDGQVTNISFIPFYHESNFNYESNSEDSQHGLQLKKENMNDLINWYIYKFNLPDVPHNIMTKIVKSIEKGKPIWNSMIVGKKYQIKNILNNVTEEGVLFKISYITPYGEFYCIFDFSPNYYWSNFATFERIA
jgi:hypothetical protein